MCKYVAHVHMCRYVPGVYMHVSQVYCSAQMIVTDAVTQCVFSVRMHVLRYKLSRKGTFFCLIYIRAIRWQR